MKDFYSSANKEATMLLVKIYIAALMRAEYVFCFIWSWNLWV